MQRPIPYFKSTVMPPLMWKNYAPSSLAMIGYIKDDLNIITNVGHIYLNCGSYYITIYKLALGENKAPAYRELSVPCHTLDQGMAQVERSFKLLWIPCMYKLIAYHLGKLL